MDLIKNISFTTGGPSPPILGLSLVQQKIKTSLLWDTSDIIRAEKEETGSNSRPGSKAKQTTLPIGQICFLSAKVKQGMLLPAASYYALRKPAWLFLLCLFLLAGTTISMRGGCCQVLLKLALLHLARVCRCSPCIKKQRQTVVTAARRKRLAPPTLCWIDLMQTAKVLSSSSVQQQSTHGKLKGAPSKKQTKIEIFCLQATSCFASHLEKLYLFFFFLATHCYHPHT